MPPSRLAPAPPHQLISPLLVLYRYRTVTAPAAAFCSSCSITWAFIIAGVRAVRSTSALSVNYDSAKGRYSVITSFYCDLGQVFQRKPRGGGFLRTLPLVGHVSSELSEDLLHPYELLQCLRVYFCSFAKHGEFDNTNVAMHQHFWCLLLRLAHPEPRSRTTACAGRSCNGGEQLVRQYVPWLVGEASSHAERYSHPHIVQRICRPRYQ